MAALGLDAIKHLNSNFLHNKWRVRLSIAHAVLKGKTSGYLYTRQCLLMCVFIDTDVVLIDTATLGMEPEDFLEIAKLLPNLTKISNVALLLATSHPPHRVACTQVITFNHKTLNIHPIDDVHIQMQQEREESTAKPEPKKRRGSIVKSIFSKKSKKYAQMVFIFFFSF